MDGAASKAFVDALYRKVLLAVKASNAVPSEDDDFHYHSRFSTAFAAHVAARGASAEALVWQLARAAAGSSNSSSKKQAKNAAGGNGDSDDDDEDDDTELFEGPEPKARITDVVDALLDNASKQLELFQRGGASAASAGSGLRPLENKPQGFDKKKSGGGQEAVATTTTTTTSTTGSGKLSAGMSKPQDQFDERIDNSDAPFVSKLREKVHALHGVTPTGSNGDDLEDEEDEEDEDALLRQQHPYYAEVKALKYAEWQLAAADDASAYKKIPVEDASYLWVNSDETLAEMVAALSKPEARVIAVDLEHHSYRSYMGLVCLMQISTATEDFLVDTLALRAKLQVLNRVLCDPAKVKVLHGADMDILWLQRDLGLYVVNMFDTGQAARLLQYPRFSLAYLLKRHCGVDADKQYQLADWRVRPLERNMVKYAREDTRYLLYIYDQMKRELLAASSTSRASLLFEALRNSSKLCLQVYAKPRVSEADCAALSDKLKSTVGLPELSELQHRVFTLLYFWRDRVARAEDESTGYVLPNHALMKLAKSAPSKAEQLFRACNPVPPLVRKYAHELTSQISAEKAKLAAEEAKASAAQPTSTSDVATAKRSSHWRAADEDVTMESSTVFASSSHMSEYAGWASGRRTAKCMAAAGANTVASGLRASFATLVTPQRPETESESEASRLARVNQLVARIAFVVTENDRPSDAAAAPAAPAAAPAAPAAATSSSDALPQSIAETYQMGSRAKRRKVQQADDNVVAAVAGDDDAAASASAPAAFQAFDYSAASAQVAAAAFNMADATRANERPSGGRKKRGGAAGASGGRGYNPFVAVRGAAGAGDAAGEELSGAAKAVKRMHHMPRSATFR